MTIKPDSPSMELFLELADRMKMMITNFPLNKMQNLQAELPIKKGGLACRNLKQFSCAARISNLAVKENSKNQKDIIAMSFHNTDITRC